MPRTTNDDTSSTDELPETAKPPPPYPTEKAVAPDKLEQGQGGAVKKDRADKAPSCAARHRVLLIVACAVCSALLIASGVAAAVASSSCFSLKKVGDTVVQTRNGVGAGSSVTFDRMGRTALKLEADGDASKGTWVFSTNTYAERNETGSFSKPTLEGSSSSLTYKGNLDEASRVRSGCAEREVDVSAPSAVRALTVLGSSSEYEIDGLTVLDTCELSVDSGALSAYDLRTATLSVAVSSGAADVDDVRAAALSLRVGSGHGSAKEVVLEKLTWSKGGGEPSTPACTVLVSVASGSGAVEVRKGAGRGPCTLDLSVDSGSLSVDLEGFSGTYWSRVQSGSLSVRGDGERGTFGAGGADVLTIHVASGSASVRFR